jgi:hypothetical protein
MAGPDPSEPARSGADESRRHAEFRAGASPSGIGAAAAYSGLRGSEHVWECIVTDTHEWHYVRVVGSEIGAYPDLSPEDVEQGIERFAATLSSSDRIHQLLNANPLHIDRQGNVGD